MIPLIPSPLEIMAEGRGGLDLFIEMNEIENLCYSNYSRVWSVNLPIQLAIGRMQ